MLTLLSHYPLLACRAKLAAQQREAAEREAKLHSAEAQAAASKQRLAAYNAALQEVRACLSASPRAQQPSSAAWEGLRVRAAPSPFLTQTHPPRLQSAHAVSAPAPLPPCHLPPPCHQPPLPSPPACQITVFRSRTDVALLQGQDEAARMEEELAACRKKYDAVRSVAGAVGYRALGSLGSRARVLAGTPCLAPTWAPERRMPPLTTICLALDRLHAMPLSSSPRCAALSLTAAPAAMPPLLLLLPCAGLLPGPVAGQARSQAARAAHGHRRAAHGERGQAGGPAGRDRGCLAAHARGHCAHGGRPRCAEAAGAHAVPGARAWRLRVVAGMCGGACLTSRSSVPWHP